MTTNSKILVIDDDPLVLKSFSMLLSRDGFDVLSASSCDEAIAIIETEDFDLILSDIRMPGKNGIETVSEIQSKLITAGKKDLPIIFITGYAEDSQELQANFVGEVLYKPVDNSKLLSAIRDYL